MTNGRFQVGAPRFDDAEGLAFVHVQGWREAYGDLLPERFYDDSALRGRQAMWSRLLSFDDVGERARVARQGDQIIGFALRGSAAEHLGHSAVRDDQLFALYVLERWYGKGVGLQLLEQLLQGRPAQLWVAKDNGRARRFYEKNGFRDDGFEQVDQDLDGLVEVRMVR